MKQLSKREIAQLKRTAQNVAPLVTKKYKILEKAEMLKKEYDSINIFFSQRIEIYCIINTIKEFRWKFFL